MIVPCKKHREKKKHKNGQIANKSSPVVKLKNALLAGLVLSWRITTPEI